ncbi:MAG: hypothetical protein R3C28_33290 [Pirellulaceae bacterium]
MTSWVRMGIPLLMGASAMMGNMVWINYQFQETEYAQLARAVTPAQKVTLQDFRPAKIPYANSKTTGNALVPWSELGSILNRRPKRRLEEGDMVLTQDFLHVEFARDPQDGYESFQFHWDQPLGEIKPPEHPVVLRCDEMKHKLAGNIIAYAVDTIQVDGKAKSVYRLSVEFKKNTEYVSDQDRALINRFKEEHNTLSIEY